jgi:hypothetical protein
MSEFKILPIGCALRQKNDRIGDSKRTFWSSVYTGTFVTEKLHLMTEKGPMVGHL